MQPRGEPMRQADNDRGFNAQAPVAHDLRQARRAVELVAFVQQRIEHRAQPFCLGGAAQILD